MKQLLIVAHSPSPNTQALCEQIRLGAEKADTDTVHVSAISAFNSNHTDVINADAIILFTPENLGYMSGALKDFFDRVYYPCLELTQGLPFATCIRAGHDGTGTKRAIDTITTGLRWKAAQPTLICKGEFHDQFLTQCNDLGTYMAIALDNGIL